LRRDRGSNREGLDEEEEKEEEEEGRRGSDQKMI
jgi:hypothetical protein